MEVSDVTKSDFMLIKDQSEPSKKILASLDKMGQIITKIVVFPHYCNL